ncbi:MULTISPECIES: hypothetical protein [Streptomyces]|uniref:Uncharacterized protein n=1 Tax=Streptomyces solicathayae TaxID=3081768 RepID=A0ABZ0LSY5_9ACTN|nr:hypothetical protein [Streptomyces sp. HUAS YS2]WOX22455.1 hypothetical protein R2D22_14040 [Streptomyces sp. HUAS YS2]
MPPSSAYEPWFFVGEGDDDAFATLEGARRTFVGVLRERAVTWPGDPADTSVLLPEETGFAHPLAVLRVVSRETGVLSHVFGVLYDGQGVLGTEVHEQMYLPRHGSAAGMLRVGGSPTLCAERTADWLERILRDPPA